LKILHVSPKSSTLRIVLSDLKWPRSPIAVRDRKNRELLASLVVAGKFRQDLFLRFNVARIHLPPLAERKEDIPDLLQFFLNQYRETTGHCVEGFTPELMKCLLYYNWPGNVREIRNLVEAIFIDPPSGLVSFENLPPTFARIFQMNIEDASNERDRIISALCAADWNKAKAAELLKISRMTLYRKMEKFGMSHRGRAA
jgi:transcriptional regulator with PAS, ATPase and Fis domain